MSVIVVTATQPGSDQDVPADRRPRRRRLSGLGWVGILVLLVVWSMRGAGFNAGFFTNARAQEHTRRFVDGFLHPDLSLSYLAEVAPVSFLAAANLAANRTPGLSRWRRAIGLAPYRLARNTLNLLRAVPELVWAFVFISAVGLGPFAGALAIGLHSAGLFGKL